VGTALLSAAREVAADAGCRRIWLVTTNDNTPAMRFYERRGFRQSAVYRDALDRSRVLKPEIPEIGLNGVPIRDEIEYEILLAVTDSPGE
jgi:RimJ/RimL family protein N-acetyltransferase